MLSKNKVIIEYWEVDCGDLGIHRMTTAQLNEIMQAENRNTRFIKFNDLVINIAFIRGAKKIVKRYSEQDLVYKTIDKRDVKFITHDERPKKISTRFYLNENNEKIIIENN